MTLQRSSLGNERGAPLYLVAMLMVVFMSAIGVGVDLGRGYIIRNALGTAVDGAALAAARMLPQGQTPARRRPRRSSPPTSRPDSSASPRCRLRPSRSRPRSDGSSLITVSSNAVLPTSFMRVAGGSFNNFDVQQLGNGDPASRRHVVRDRPLRLVERGLRSREDLIRHLRRQVRRRVRPRRAGVVLQQHPRPQRDRSAGSRLREEHHPVADQQPRLQWRHFDRRRPLPGMESAAPRPPGQSIELAGDRAVHRRRAERLPHDDPSQHPRRIRSRELVQRRSQLHQARGCHLARPPHWHAHQQRRDPGEQRERAWDSGTPTTPIPTCSCFPPMGTAGNRPMSRPTRRSPPAFPKFPPASTHTPQQGTASGIPFSFPLFDGALAAQRGLIGCTGTPTMCPNHVQNANNAARNLTEIIADRIRDDHTGLARIHIFTLGSRQHSERRNRRRRRDRARDPAACGERSDLAAVQRHAARRRLLLRRQPVAAGSRIRSHPRPHRPHQPVARGLRTADDTERGMQRPALPLVPRRIPSRET